jgi:TRAP-type C4-dicarboxylate transport system substrate-binding protein
MKIKLLSITAAGLALIAFTGVSQSAPEVTLKLHHLLGPKSLAQTQMLEPWVKRVERDSGGRIKIDIYPSMSLGGTPPQLIRQVRDGVVDIVWTVNGYTAGQFPRSEVFELPFVHTNNAVATNLAMYDMFDKYLKPEFEDVHVIVLHVHAGQAFQMVDTPIRTVGDVKGKKIRIPTRTGAWLLEALGANPVGMPVPALPQALAKKVVDGALIPWEIIPPLKIQELTKYQIEGENRVRFGTTTFQISMNKQKYDSLPADLKAAIDKNSGRGFAIEVGRIWTRTEDVGLKVAMEHGNEHIVIPKIELKNFEARLQPVVDRWIAEVKEKGIDGTASVKEARRLIAKYSNEK